MRQTESFFAWCPHYRVVILIIVFWSLTLPATFTHPAHPAHPHKPILPPTHPTPLTTIFSLVVVLPSLTLWSNMRQPLMYRSWSTLRVLLPHHIFNPLLIVFHQVEWSVDGDDERLSGDSGVGYTADIKWSNGSTTHCLDNPPAFDCGFGQEQLLCGRIGLQESPLEKRKRSVSVQPQTADGH